jgi:RNA polymerase sigma-70 factor (ECF subfamily)
LAPPQQRFQALLLPVRQGLYRFALKLTADPARADDLFHQAVVVGLSRIDQLVADAAFRAWMSRIVYHTHLNEQKRRQRGDGSAESLDNVVSLPSAQAPPDREVDRARVSDHIARALAGLPDAQAQAVWLVDGQGFKYSEAAEILSIPRGTAATLVARGRKALRETLRDWKDLAEEGR